MIRLLRHPGVWFAALLVWLVVLWFASSLHGSRQTAPPFPHFDKFTHFAYFLTGGFLLTGGNFRKNPEQPSWRAVLLTTIVVMAAIGAIDEWHQTFTPGRSGNDPWDWLADVLGGAFGAFFLKAIHHRLK